MSHWGKLFRIRVWGALHRTVVLFWSMAVHCTHLKLFIMNLQPVCLLRSIFFLTDLLSIWLREENWKLRPRFEQANVCPTALNDHGEVRGAFHYFKWVLDAKTKFAGLLHGVSPSCKCLGRTVARLADTADSRPLCRHIPPAGARVTGHRNINQSEGDK